MKILTLNTHSLIEDDYENKCRIFAEGIAQLRPDIIALQEVNQSIEKSVIENTDKIFSAGSIPLKADNHAVKIACMLSRMGITYNLVWTGIKKGYGMYDEGIAILSVCPIQNAFSFTISKINDYENWKKRKALIANTCGISICTAHMGWWNDIEEPFETQFLKLDSEIKKRQCCVLTGDFNSSDTIIGEGYDLVRSAGWNDVYMTSEIKEGYHTVSGPIAGWNQNDKIRIDYIFADDSITAKNCQTVFDGTRFDTVSDHFGVIADIERSIP